MRALAVCAMTMVAGLSPASDGSASPVVIHSHAIARHFTHTHGFPMYVTNAAVIDAARGLYLMRITPLTIACSALPIRTVADADYAQNSWSALVATSGLTATVLHRWNNSQDARGVVQGDDLWVAHNYKPPHATNDSGVGARQVGSRIELRRYTMRYEAGASTPSVSLAQQSRLHWSGSGPKARGEKNWVPLVLDQQHALLSHSIEPHRVLRCEMASGECVVAHETSRPELWAVVTDSASATAAAGCGGRACGADFAHAAGAKHPPRGGTPCVPLLGMWVCLGHARRRLRGEYRATYFHFFYALETTPPYAVLNVSHPFRFGKLPTAKHADVLRALGSTFTRRQAKGGSAASFFQEKIQFATGLVFGEPRRPSPRGSDLGLSLDHAAGPPRTLVVSYGIADCAAAWRSVAVDDVARLLARTLVTDRL